MKGTHAVEDETKLRAIVLLHEDPRTSQEDYVKLRPDIIGCELVAYVAPDHILLDKKNYYFDGHGNHGRIPLISWEEPNTDKLRASQYLYLFNICRADIAIHLGWRYDIPGASEAGIITVLPRSFRNLEGEKLSRLLHIKIHGLTPTATAWPTLLDDNENT